MELENRRYALPLTIDQSKVIVEALQVYYNKIRLKTMRLAKHYGDDIGLSTKEKEPLVRIQECLQYVTLIHNIETGKLNPDVAAAGGLTIEEETTSDIGEPEPNRDKGETGSLP